MNFLSFILIRKFIVAGPFFLFFAGCLAGQTPSRPAASAPMAVPTATAPAVSPSLAAITYSAVHVEGPFIAMTFDDGPSAKLTPELLDILAARQIHATFFVIGKNASAHPEILQRAVREGHEIGNHTWSHPAFRKMSDESVRAELQKTDEAIRSALGGGPVLMRPPYGSITARQKRWINERFGYRIILWDVDPLDWKRPGPTVVANRIVKEARPGSIILSHEIHPATIKAMPETLDGLHAKGFQFVTVSELIAMGSPMPAKPPGSEGPAPVASPGEPTATTAAGPKPNQHRTTP